MSYYKYITENKDRFIDKNKNLTNDQKRKAKEWVAGHNHTVKRFVKQQPNHSSDVFSYMTWEEYEELFDTETKTSKKRDLKRLRHQGVSGMVEGKDYYSLKLSNPYYVAYIPLHYEAAQIIGTSTVFNRDRANWCISSSKASYFYKTEAIKPKKIPVMVLNSKTRYTVMIKPNNRSWEIWYASNNPNDVRTDEGIPDFSISRDLIGSKQSKLYDHIRDDVWGSNKEPISEEERRAAARSYEQIIFDIENYHHDVKYAIEDGLSSLKEIAEDTLEKYSEELAYIEEDLENDDGDSPKYTEHLNKEAETLRKYIDAIEQIINNGDFESMIAHNRYFKEDDILDKIDWEGYIPETEYEFAEGVEQFSVRDFAYEDYSDFNETHGNGRVFREDFGLESVVHESALYDEKIDAEKILEDHEYYHPNNI